MISCTKHTNILDIINIFGPKGLRTEMRLIRRVYSRLCATLFTETIEVRILSRYTIDLNEFNLLNDARQNLSDQLEDLTVTGSDRVATKLALDAADLVSSCCIVGSDLTSSNTKHTDSNEQGTDEDDEEYEDYIPPSLEPESEDAIPFVVVTVGDSE